MGATLKKRGDGGYVLDLTEPGLHKTSAAMDPSLTQQRSSVIVLVRVAGRSPGDIDDALLYHGDIDVLLCHGREELGLCPTLVPDAAGEGSSFHDAAAKGGRSPYAANGKAYDCELHMTTRMVTANTLSSNARATSLSEDRSIRRGQIKTGETHPTILFLLLHGELSRFGLDT